MTKLTYLDPTPRLSEAVIHGDKIYTGGIVADSALGKSVAEQTADILDRIDALLARAKTDKSKIIKANIWLADIKTIGEMNAIWDAWVVPGAPPARATVEAKLANPGYAVEIMIEAAI